MSQHPGWLEAEYLPQALASYRILSQLVKRIVFAQSSEATLQIINDRPRGVCLRAIRTNARSKMDIVVNG